MKQNKVVNILEYELPIKIDKDRSGGFVATSPAWKDCYAQGDSVDEVVNEISAVAASLIELYKEESMEIPLKVRASDKRILTIPVITSP